MSVEQASLEAIARAFSIQAELSMEGRTIKPVIKDIIAAQFKGKRPIVKQAGLDANTKNAN